MTAKLTKGGNFQMLLGGHFYIAANNTTHLKYRGNHHD